ncbi:MAG: LamG-like jellyroll fold domain-containing protein, partial [Balneolaceae bacterium]
MNFTIRLLTFSVTCLTFLLSSGLPGNTACGQSQGAGDTDLELRRSPVSFHLSFDSGEIFEEDFLEQSGRKSVGDREIDFPAGRFGKAIRMSFIPDPPDATNMTRIDLGLTRAVIANARPGSPFGFNQLVAWGSGKISTRLGAVAFWARGELPFHGALFEQASISFGRTERDLIGIVVDEDNNLGAYLRDARYERHEISTDVSWEEDRWNHIVMNWDWANGLELWLNGRKIGSSWGDGGWFATAPPGLFHLPMPMVSYDELYLMDRPLSEAEIMDLSTSNTPPGDDAPVYSRDGYDAERLSHYSGGDAGGSLPVATPGTALSFTEVWPEFAGDGNIPGWHVIDGRNEMAWPHPYALFTIIPGDVDFHAEKVDLRTSPGSKVNYITLTGNLTNVKVQAGSEAMGDVEDLFRVPEGHGFFYGSTITATEGSTFRIPFTEGYGTPTEYSFEGASYRIPYNEEYGSPTGFKGDVNLPLSGRKRIQNVGLYHYTTTPSAGYRPAGGMHPLRLTDAPVLDRRGHFSLHAVTSRDERTFAVTSGEGAGTARSVDIGAFSRLNIMSGPYHEKTGVTSVTLSLPVKTMEREETLFVRVHDPALPLRLWNEFAVNLTGFDEDYRRLLLRIDFQDIVLAGGDRLWLDVGTAGSTEVRIGGDGEPAALFVEGVESYRAVDAYAEKEMIPARA